MAILKHQAIWLITLLFLAVPWSAGRAEEPYEIRLTLHDHHFEPALVEVPANRELRLVVTNADATPEEFESIGLKIERILPPGTTAVFRVRPLLANRNYRFFGEFHPDTAEGQLVVK